MQKILILYFSGVKNTKYVAEYIYEIVTNNYSTELKSIEELPCNYDLSQLDRIIIGTSTIHSEPPRPMKEFLKAINRSPKRIPAFIYATYGLYPENVLRVLGMLCLKKNIVPIHYSGYRCSATDGVLLVPSISFFKHNEKNIKEKIKKDVFDFLSNCDLRTNLPKYKWYGIFNYPNKWVGQHFRFKIYLHKKYCSKCGKCILNCPVKAICKDDLGYPCINRKQCINCYRCIHKCPFMALSLYKSKRHKKT